MTLTAEQIEIMRGALRSYWRGAGHETDAPDALCDLALQGLRSKAVPQGCALVPVELLQKCEDLIHSEYAGSKDYSGGVLQQLGALLAASAKVDAK